MQQHDTTYKPEWIKEEDACAWLGVTRVTLIRWRTSQKLAYTNINGRTVMYDKRQINALLNNNSTYKFEGKKLVV
jgi:predicted site-specific integrase-resolvase